MKVFLHVHFYGASQDRTADGSVLVCNTNGIVFYEAHVVPDCVILLAEDSFRSKLLHQKYS